MFWIFLVSKYDSYVLHNPKNYKECMQLRFPRTSEQQKYYIYQIPIIYLNHNLLRWSLIQSVICNISKDVELKTDSNWVDFENKRASGFSISFVFWSRHWRARLQTPPPHVLVHGVAHSAVQAVHCPLLQIRFVQILSNFRHHFKSEQLKWYYIINKMFVL